MKKSYTYLSSATIFNTSRRLVLPRILKRQVSIKSMYEIKDQRDFVSSQIIHTDNNQLEKENDIDYVKRSFIELSRQIHRDMTGKNLVIFKINQCLIDPDKWENEGAADPIYNGHVIVGLFKIDPQDNKLILVPNSTVSKIRKGIEDEQVIYQQRFFYNKELAKYASVKRSNEYFWIITLDKLNMSQQTFLDRCKNMRHNPGKFDLLKSACCQSIYRLITDKPAAEVTSPQTATVLAVLDVLSNPDDRFNLNLRNSLMESGLSKFANELGREYFNFLSSNENQPSLSNSRT